MDFTIPTATVGKLKFCTKESGPTKRDSMIWRPSYEISERAREGW